MKHLDFIKKDGAVGNIAAIHQWLDKSIKYLTNGGYTLTITKVVKRRSLSQNRLMWMWFRCLEDGTGVVNCFQKILGREFVTPDGEIERLQGHTSTLNTAQMTDFLNKVQADAATEWGVTLPLPEDVGYDEFRMQFERLT